MILSRLIVNRHKEIKVFTVYETYAFIEMKNKCIQINESTLLNKKETIEKDNRTLYRRL